MGVNSCPQRWTIKQQVIKDPVSGLSFEFSVTDDGELRMTLQGDCLVFKNRTLVFNSEGDMVGGETTISSSQQREQRTENGYKTNPYRPKSPK